MNFFSYLFIERWNGYQLFEQINQPLSLQYNCYAMLDYHPQTMVKMDHGLKLFVIFHETIFLRIVLKLLQISVINLLGHQSFNHLFKQKPSRREQNTQNALGLKLDINFSQTCTYLQSSSINSSISLIGLAFSKPQENSNMVRFFP